MNLLAIIATVSLQTGLPTEDYLAQVFCDATLAASESDRIVVASVNFASDKNLICAFGVFPAKEGK